MRRDPTWRNDVSWLRLNSEILFHALALLVALLGCGCSSVAVLHQESDFRARDLENGKVAIAVIAGSGGGEHPLAPRISAVLTESFKAAYPKIELYPLAESKGLLSPVEMETFLSRFSTEGELRESDLQLFLPLRVKARYILLLNVGGGNGMSMRNRAQRIHRRWAQDPDTGRYQWNYYYQSHETPPVPWTGCNFFLCDLETKKLVWVGAGGSGLATEPEPGTIETSDSVSSGSLAAGADVIRTITRELLKKLPQ